MPVRVRIIVIASAIIALAWWKKEELEQMSFQRPADFDAFYQLWSMISLFLMIKVPENDRYTP